MSELKVGVIGVGDFGKLHLDGYRTLHGVEVVAICDVNRRRLDEIGEEYGIEARYTDFDDLCGRSDLDLISIVTPESEHVAPVEKAAQSKKHIFLEKPIGTSVEDAARIVEVASREEVFLMVGHILRFESKYATVKRLIDEGELGRIVSINARRNRSKSLYPIYGNRVHGLLVNAIHDIDLCLWYFGDRVKRVRGITRNIQGGLNPDVNWGFLEFSDGGVASLETHWMIPEQAGVMTDDSMQVIGTDGIANIDFVPSGLTLWQESGSITANVSYDAWFHNEIRGPVKEELAYFVDCVRRKEEPSVITPGEALEALRVSLALIESASTGKEIDL